MGTEQEHKSQNGLAAVLQILERLGVPGDADWMAVVLFARNLVSTMDLFTADQKAQIQAKTFEELGKRPLDRKRFQHIVQTLQSFMQETTKVEDLRNQLATERRSFTTLYEEMAKVFSEIQHTTKARETDIQRLGQDTEQSISAAGSRSEVVSLLRSMVTDLVDQARQETRTWQDRAQQLEHTASFDPLLSELYSRRALDAQIGLAVERCHRDNKPLSFMFLDVDHFKVVNDTHGHQVGDGVLRVLSAILSAHSLQFSGYAARYGGEELVVLCEGLDETSAMARAEDIRLDVSRCPFMPHIGQDQSVPPLHITVSIGVAQIGPGQGPSELILAADQSMYAAKTQGRNRVVSYSSLATKRAT